MHIDGTVGGEAETIADCHVAVGVIHDGILCVGRGFVLLTSTCLGNDKGIEVTHKLSLKLFSFFTFAVQVECDSVCSHESVAYTFIGIKFSC